MNFGGVGFGGLFAVLFLGFLFRVVPIVIAIWFLVVVHRMRRRIDALSARLDALAPPSVNPR